MALSQDVESGRERAGCGRWRHVTALPILRATASRSAFVNSSEWRVPSWFGPDPPVPFRRSLRRK